MRRNYRVKTWVVIGIAVLLVGCDLNFLQNPVAPGIDDDPPRYSVQFLYSILGTAIQVEALLPQNTTCKERRSRSKVTRGI